MPEQKSCSNCRHFFYHGAGVQYICLNTHAETTKDNICSNWVGMTKNE